MQAQSQLKSIYKDNMETIIGNCDSRVFLGGSERTTLDELSKTLGKETIDMYNTSVTQGRHRQCKDTFEATETVYSNNTGEYQTASLTIRNSGTENN